MEVKKYKDGIVLSRLGMGNMRLPVIEGTEDIDFEKSQEIIDYGMANGINYYDTAYVYSKGDSERFLGVAMKKFKRESFYLATKWHIGANPDFKAVFEEQLDRLKTDYIDFYLIHCLTDENIDSYINSGGIEYFKEMKKIGKIKYLGFSSHASVETLRRFADYTDWDFAQLQINYLDWNYARTKEEYQVLADRGIPNTVMEPVRGGRLAKLNKPAEDLLRMAHPNWSIASWALRWVRTLPNVQVILSGMSSLDQIKDNVGTFKDDTPFTKEDEEILFRACELFHNNVHIPCTACRYCCEDCPMQINIPEYLALLNDFKIEGYDTFEDREEIKSEGTPDMCIKCGTCMAHCPQNIKIPEHLEDLTNILKNVK